MKDTDGQACDIGCSMPCPKCADFADSAAICLHPIIMNTDIRTGGGYTGTILALSQVVICKLTPNPHTYSLLITNQLSTSIKYRYSVWELGIGIGIRYGCRYGCRCWVWVLGAGCGVCELG